MAFSLEANVYLATYAIWSDPADDERHRAWVHGHLARLAEEVGEGLYVGDSDFTRGRTASWPRPTPPAGGDPRRARPGRRLRPLPGV